MSGLRIKQFRERNKYSQKDLASILDVSVRTIARWEQNNTKPNSDELKKLATLMGVSEDEILNDADTEFDSSTELTNQKLIAKISDSVENLVTGQDTINESLTSNRDEYIKKQNELIQELRKQNADLIEKLDTNNKTYNLQKELLRQKKIRNAILIGLAITIIVIIIFSIWITMSIGPDPNTVYVDQPIVVKNE